MILLENIDISKLSPMMRRYVDLKSSYPDSILLFRLGDFYEMFFDDAVTASKILDITLTGRDCGIGERAPMCGVPYHAVDGYIEKLISSGQKVAICEQLSEPDKTKGMVERDVVRVISAGTLVEDNILNNKSNNYILSAATRADGFAISWCDISTGDFFAMDNLKTLSMFLDAVSTISPSEIIASNAITDTLKSNTILCGDKSVRIYNYYDNAFKIASAKNTITNHYNIASLKVFDLEESEGAIIASGALLSYLIDTQKRSLSQLKKISLVRANDILILDNNTRRNLELTQTIRGGKVYGSLLWAVDYTKTSMGARMLKNWIEQPLTNEKSIKMRQQGIGEIISNCSYSELTDCLSGVKDVERLLTKAVYGSINPRDMLAILDTLLAIPDLLLILSKCSTKILDMAKKSIKTFDNLVTLLASTIEENPPVNLRDGGFIKRGYSKELDKHLDAKNNSKQWLANLEAHEREKTGIKPLKISYNKVFGYFIEITKSYLDKVPFDYIRKQTVANGERYITPELKDIEEALLGSEQKAIDLEIEIFNNIKVELMKNMEALQQTARAISAIDCLNSLAICAVKNNYICPNVSAKSDHIHIKQGRHPVVDKILPDKQFIPNDTMMDTGDNQTIILTGPNMSGKSTFMRQIATLALLAHVGSYIPCESADICVIDRIFTRIGAGDDLLSSQSTFMVEMLEVSNILHNATNKSLLILDEIGRGTSTTDGLSIAWAVLEYVAKSIKAKTIFATHFHEICELEDKLGGVKNYKVLVNELGGTVVFLHKITRGSASKSFGIEVAELAGVPSEVVERAKAIAKNVDAMNKSMNLETILEEKFTAGSKQQSFFEVEASNKVTAILKDVDINNLSPMQALVCLADLVKIAKEC